MTTWFIAAALLLIFELFAGTVYLLVVSAALFGAGVVAWLTDNITAAVITAAVLSALGIWLSQGWIREHRRSPAEEMAQNDLDIGQTVQILRHLHTDRYEVLYRGTHWQAQALNPASVSQPHTAVITGKNGNVLLVHLH
ncbi:NfeD family protein [Neisseria perflava]|uniref:NfeD family protein n=1 Tax=Neisseria perflava TaxID=33053 RepID=UPI00209EE158|nr:NfeD family protein [Neisseria perflava]MCP1659663.1 membrane protein implicated in regulation of membrane protease activity [Neisseria perflava]MCP1771317.1 membrane protein implicated in regulation of membrane protease activity [Neisseria perflava]